MKALERKQIKVKGMEPGTGKAEAITAPLT